MAKHRSPAYPAIDLEQAVTLTETLYPDATRHPIGADVVAEKWGYKGLTSASPYIAAAKQFGLIVESKNGADRMLQLSDSGRDIAIDKDGQTTERRLAIKRAATFPAVFAEMWDKWGGDIPPDGEIRRYLVRERDFNPKHVAKVAANYRSTLEFAKLVGELVPSIKNYTDDDIDSGASSPKTSREPESHSLPAVVGSIIDWPTNPDTFPDKIVSISDDRDWVFVDRTNDGIPMSEITVLSPPREPMQVVAPPKKPMAREETAVASPNGPFLSITLADGVQLEIRLSKRISKKDFGRLQKLVELSEDSFVQQEDSDSEAS